MKIKTLFALAVAGLFFVACKQTDAEVKSTETAAVVGKTETASFTIEGMSCAVGCANTLQKKLSATEGVQKATVDFEKKTASVDYDSAKTSPEQLVAVVEKAAGGETYKVSNLKTTADKAMLSIDKDKKKKKKAKKGETSEEKPADKAGCADDKAPAKGGCCAKKTSCHGA